MTIEHLKFKEISMYISLATFKYQTHLELLISPPLDQSLTVQDPQNAESINRKTEKTELHQ